jgi:hypothetical protein
MILNRAELFQQKMNFIFEKISNSNLDEFSKLFYIKGKTTFENRRYNLNKNWLKKATISKTFHKEYHRYPFSLKLYNGQKLFKDVHEFLEIGLVDFQEKIQAYVEYKRIVLVPKDMNYTHLYTFSSNGIEKNDNIDAYQIEHLKHQGNRVDILVRPPRNKVLLNIDAYSGTLKLKNSKIILTFENSQDYISAIFNLELINRHTKFLVGVIIGIADINEKIPVSKKVILTKAPVKNVNELYLILNETEIISAKENAYEFKYHGKNLLNTHLKKYIQKVQNVNNVFKKLSKQGYFTSFYEQVAFQEFSATNNLFQKFNKNHSFYVHYRKRILNILIDSYKNEPYKKLFMVMPIYQEENPFEEQSDNAIKLQKGLKELSKDVKIEIIFVIKDCEKPFKQEFMVFLKEVYNSVKIGFVFKDKIEYEVNSFDFFYTDNSDFVVSKSLRTNITAFQLYQHKNSINEYHAIFRTISNRSISYQEFIASKTKICTKENPLLKKLSGEWYHYFYGSKFLWEDKVLIFEDGRVEYYCEEQKREEGKIITKEYQSIILLSDKLTKRLSTIIFDHQPYQIQKAFFTKNIAKQIETNLDIFSIGILSRKPIPEDKVIEILGDIEDARFLEKGMMSKKLANYLSDIT